MAITTKSMDATVVRSFGSSSVAVTSNENTRDASLPLHRVSDSVLYLVTQTPSRKPCMAGAGLYNSACLALTAVFSEQIIFDIVYPLRVNSGSPQSQALSDLSRLALIFGDTFREKSDMSAVTCDLLSAFQSFRDSMFILRVPAVSDWYACVLGATTPLGMPEIDSLRAAILTCTRALSQANLLYLSASHAPIPVHHAQSDIFAHISLSAVRSDGGQPITEHSPASAATAGGASMRSCSTFENDLTEPMAIAISLALDSEPVQNVLLNLTRTGFAQHARSVCNLLSAAKTLRILQQQGDVLADFAQAVMVEFAVLRSAMADIKSADLDYWVASFSGHARRTSVPTAHDVDSLVRAFLICFQLLTEAGLLFPASRSASLQLAEYPPGTDRVNATVLL